MRQIGVVAPFAADDPEEQVRVAAFVQGLQQLGWTDGRNVQIDYRWAAGDADRMRNYAAELVALAPDVILVPGGTAVGPLLQVTRTAPSNEKRPSFMVHRPAISGCSPLGQVTKFVPRESRAEALLALLAAEMQVRPTPDCGRCQLRRHRPDETPDRGLSVPWGVEGIVGGTPPVL
jgi:hypothetical protein